MKFNKNWLENLVGVTVIHIKRAKIRTILVLVFFIVKIFISLTKIPFYSIIIKRRRIMEDKIIKSKFKEDIKQENILTPIIVNDIIGSFLTSQDFTYHLTKMMLMLSIKVLILL